MSDVPFVVLERLTKRFGGVAAVDGLSLGIPRGDLLALLGPSGSGKTTTLRLLAGFETPDEGRIVVDGEDVIGTPPAGRRFGMVFQHYALFPHLDVGENVAFGLESLGVAPAERERRGRAARGPGGAAGARRGPGGAGAAGEGGARAGGACRARATAGERALRRAAAAGRAGPGARPRTAGALPGRAALQPRPGTPGTDPAGAPGPDSPDRHHHHPGDP